MNPFKNRIFFLQGLIYFFLFSCKPFEADTLYINGIVHSMDNANSIAQAIAVKDGKIVAVGTTSDLKFKYKSDTIIDLGGHSVFPGLYDSHCHFFGYAKNLGQVDLVGTKSWEEVLARVDTFFARGMDTDWIVGRGWDQNDWDTKEFPNNTKLNEQFPDVPVILQRIDGHAAICNAKALELAGIQPGTKLKGGIVGTTGRNLNGLLIDNAVDLVSNIVPDPDRKSLIALLKKAEQNCFAVGLTTLDEAGLPKEMIFLLDSLQKAEQLKMRFYVMAEPNKENLDHFFKNGPLKTDRLSVRSFKIYADGALGSRGACLLQSYRDEPGNYGFILQDETWFEDIAKKLYEKGFQMNTHCIGDSAVRMMLRIYGHNLKPGEDKRWRIEHAQVVNPEDIEKFKKYKVWASVQPTHAISDMPWAENRLGRQRMSGAYAYNSLFSQNGRIAFGSDFPVEDINPLLGYRASITRMDLKGFPYGGFQFEEAVRPDTALKAMTIWAAEANFEEKERGSIEVGKFADFIVMDKDFFYLDPFKCQEAKVIYTVIAGEVVYKLEE